MTKRFRTIEISSPEYEPDNLRHVTVKSMYLKGRGDCTFFIPPQIKKITPNVPVVILLHGVYASHWTWVYNINVHQVALRLIHQNKILPMVLAMPSDGLMGDGSGYLDHGEKDYEKWIARDIVDLIPLVIPESGASRQLFIAGLSMGGYGALRIAARFPTLFSGASGLSSITGLKDLLPFLAPAERNYFRKKFGGEELIEYLVKNKKKLPPFRFDCGRNDPLIHSNRRLHLALEKFDIPHVFEEFDGGHDHDYWNRTISRTLIYFSDLAGKKK